MVGAKIISGCARQGVYNHGVRWMVGKAANRAAVHGSKLPVPDAIPDCFDQNAQVLDQSQKKQVINVAIEEKERRRVEIENRVDSHLKNWKVIHVHQILCSK